LGFGRCPALKDWTADRAVWGSEGALPPIAAYQERGGGASEMGGPTGLTPLSAQDPSWSDLV
jgi:hypothetical protein